MVVFSHSCSPLIFSLAFSFHSCLKKELVLWYLRVWIETCSTAWRSGSISAETPFMLQENAALSGRCLKTQVTLLCSSAVLPVGCRGVTLCQGM